VVHVNHEGDRLIFAMTSQSGMGDHVDEESHDDGESSKDVMRVPSFWEWRVDEPFWRPEVEDTQVRRVIFTLPSVEDCWFAERFKDSKGNPVVDVRAKIAQEVKDILKYYPSVSTVELRGETPQLRVLTTFKIPPEVVDFAKSLKNVKTEVYEMNNMRQNDELVNSVFGYDDKDVPDLEYCQPYLFAGQWVTKAREHPLFPR
jgi:hypothetical protein